MKISISGTLNQALRRIIPLLCAAALLAACTPPPEPPQLSRGTLLPSPKPLLDFTLTDHTGAAFTRANLTDGWTFAFFGYTHCPDVCPTTLASLVQLRRQLEGTMPSGELPGTVFISVDPERDTPEQLAEFMPYFHPEFLGVTGDEEQILTVTRQLGILHAKAEDAGADDYLVDHSAAIILFDPDGAFHAVFGVPHDPVAMAGDFLALKHYYEAIQ